MSESEGRRALHMRVWQVLLTMALVGGCRKPAEHPVAHKLIIEASSP